MDMQQKPKRALFTSHVANFYKFNRPLIEALQADGWIVDYASAAEETIEGCRYHYKIDFRRSPLNLTNIAALFQLRQVLKKNNYQLIHCHTPMGGVVTRLAAMPFRKQGTKVVYTAHGFHFYKGAPRKNWLLYYPIEKALSYCTDCLVTMNEEDYHCAVSHGFGAQKICKVNGVGINLERFTPVSPLLRQEYRKRLGLAPEDFALIYVAEFIPRKNHQLLFQAVKELKVAIPHLKLILAGKGEDLKLRQQQAQWLGIDQQCLFLGYHTQLEEVYPACDLLVSTSIQEGLPVNLLEGMACGLPVICAAIRGQIDLIEPQINGLLYESCNLKQLVHSIELLYSDPQQRTMMGQKNLDKVEQYSLSKVIPEMIKIYQEVLTEQ